MAKYKFFSLIHFAVTIVQYALVIIIAVVIFEILSSSRYDLVLLTLPVLISHSLTAALIGLFAYRFIKWFLYSKKSYLILLYAVSFSLMSFVLINSQAQELVHISEKLQKERVVTPASQVYFPTSQQDLGPFINFLRSAYRYADLTSFLFIIVATAVLLRHYSQKLGTVKYWVLVLLPSIYYLTSYLANLNIYVPPQGSSAEFYYYLITTFSYLVGGLLLALSFVTVARTIRADSNIRKYIIITACGFASIYVCINQALFVAPYPPYGISALSFLPVSAYMLFFGLYSTAVSLSQDIQLRQSVKNIASKDVNLLSSIGTAQMDMEVRRVVRDMKGVIQEEETKLAEETGIDTPIPQDDMEDYMKQVMEEVAKARKQRQK